MRRELGTRMAAAGLAAVTMAATVCGCGSKDTASSADTDHITYWMVRGVDTGFYDSYNDNPVVKYIKNNYTFNGKTLDIDYVVAPPGSESDDFSTLLGTGQYCGVMDMSMSSSTAAELYDDGIIWDLTDLIPENMPNYMAYMEANPDVEKSIYSIVDGEKKVLQIYGLKDQPDDMFQGYCYRRDWIVKYGKNPQTGAAFTGGYTDPDDKLSWEDDVVFPSGTDEPLYISDWEWMFEIFTEAMADLGIEDGYCYAPYYVGYQRTGDLYSGFGGGIPYVYLDTETDTIADGTANDTMRAYLECMNTWWNNGWLDKSFAEHTNDMFFAIDSAKVFQGKVGLWQGRISTVGAQIDSGDGFTEGAMVYGARQPINDLYGGEEQKNKEPDACYQFSKLGTAVVLTDKLSEEEVITFLQYADFLYSEEGALLKAGLNAEQVEKAQDSFYEQTGHADGLYDLVEQDGVQKIVYKENVDTSSTEYTALTLATIGLDLVSRKEMGDDRYVKQAHEAWGAYEATASVPNGVSSAIGVEDGQELTKLNANLSQFMDRTIPTMIKGEGYDVWDDGEWNQYVGSIKKYQMDKVIEIYNKAYDSMKE